MTENDLLSSMQGSLQQVTKPSRHLSASAGSLFLDFPPELKGALIRRQVTFTEQWGDRFSSGVAVFPRSNRIIVNENGVFIPQNVLGNDVVVESEREQSPYRVSGQRATALEALEREFKSLAQRWRNETTHLSIASEKANNFAYQQIVGMGEQVLPLIFRELETTTSDWFWALRAIARDRAPVIRAEDRGRVRRIAEIWMEWGKQNGYVS